MGVNHTKECSILILSCDKNTDLLNNFNILFNKFWATCQFKKYIGLEKSSFRLDGYTTLNSNSYGWSDRVKDYLNVIETEFVLIMLDDYWIEGNVKESDLMSYLEMMINDRKIANIAFSRIYSKGDNVLNKFLIERSKKGDYLLNLQIGIWSVHKLNTLLKKGESPWEAELFGSIRARKFTNYRFISLQNDDYMPIPFNRGWLIVQGSWNGYEVDKFRDVYGLSIDTDTRRILYSGWHKINFFSRVIRRLKIELYKIIYKFKKNSEGNSNEC